MKPVSEETRKKMSLSGMGKVFSQEAKDKIGRAHSGKKAYAWKGGVSRGYKIKNAPRPKPESCEVCGRLDRICFDHNHKNGKFRGWLCFKCNIALGMVDDSYDILISLSKYIIQNI